MTNPTTDDVSAIMGKLSRSAINIARLESIRDGHMTSLKTSQRDLEAAQEEFNNLREDALEIVPALGTGFPIPHETVTIVDGRIAVTVED